MVEVDDEDLDYDPWEDDGQAGHASADGGTGLVTVSGSDNATGLVDPAGVRGVGDDGEALHETQRLPD